MPNCEVRVIFDFSKKRKNICSFEAHRGCSEYRNYYWTAVSICCFRLLPPLHPTEKTLSQMM